MAGLAESYRPAGRFISASPPAFPLAPTRWLRHNAAVQIGAIREVGERIRERRTGRGLSQAELATLADLDRLYLSRLERGLQNPSLLVLFRLALELGVELSHLLEGVTLDANEIRAVKRLSRGPGRAGSTDGGKG